MAARGGSITRGFHVCSAPYRNFKKQPLRHVSPIWMKLGRLVQRHDTYRKASWTYAPKPTGSRIFSFSKWWNKCGIWNLESRKQIVI